MRSLSWRDMSPTQRAVVVVLSPIELAMTVAAAVDLRRRPQQQVRGPKALWWLAIFVQPVGPVAYLGWGRHGRTGTGARKRSDACLCRAFGPCGPTANRRSIDGEE